jgi:hypothetical protein
VLLEVLCEVSIGCDNCSVSWEIRTYRSFQLHSEVQNESTAGSYHSPPSLLKH